MSRVHDALRRAEQGTPEPEQAAPDGLPPAPPVSEIMPVNGGLGPSNGRLAVQPAIRLNLNPVMLAEVPVVPFQPAPESHLLDLNNSHETPAEEFRTLRTRMNHLQTVQPLHTIIVSSPSPAEGKTFTAVNLRAGGIAPGGELDSAGRFRSSPAHHA